MKNKKFVLLFLPFLLTGCVKHIDYHGNEDKYFLEVDYHDDFRILQLCDIHMSASDDADLHYAFMNKTITEANADFIVLNGDLFNYADKRTVKSLFKFIDSYHTPWTFTYGNHDDQGYYNDHYLQDVIGKYQYSKFVNIGDNVSGRSNFIINLVDGSHNVKHQIFLLESHSYQFHEYFGYDYIKKDQIDWYEHMVNYSTTNFGGSVIPSTMFFHVPFPEFEEAYELEKAGDPSVTLVMGEHREYTYPQPVNSGMFAKICELGSTKTVGCSHLHVDDCVYLFNGIKLCFGVTSTDRVYADPDMMGGMLYTIQDDGTCETTIITKNYD